MLKVRIIPCLDVHAGRVVKGVRFVDLVDAGDPVEQAKVYDAAGADELCFLDITASHENRETIYDVVRGTAEITMAGETRMLHENESAYIPPGIVHRLHNPGKIPLELIEVRTGSYLGEDDIVRIEDEFGRS